MRAEDKVGNAQADAAADLERRHQSVESMDVWRALVNARSFWYPRYEAVAQVHDCCFSGDC